MKDKKINTYVLAQVEGSQYFSTYVLTSVANWPNFRPHNSKGAVKKYVRPNKLAAQFL